MRQLLIDIRNSRVASYYSKGKIVPFWEDGSIIWSPLNTYKFKAGLDYAVVEKNGSAGYSEPRIVKGDFLIALLKTLLDKKN